MQVVGVLEILLILEELRLLNLFGEVYLVLAYGVRLFTKKYLRNISVTQWLRKEKVQAAGSIIWKGLIHFLPWLKKWISWKVGDGSQVILGKDPFIGCGEVYKLPSH